MRRWAGDAAAVLLVLPLVAAVLGPGWFVGHDDLHPVRLFEQDLMIRAGQFPVRWYPDVAGGYGSAHPQFYAPFFYLLAQVFVFAGLSLTASLKAAIVIVLAGTSMAMYRLARAFFGEVGGLVAAAAGSYAPYHLLDLFVRTAFSELTVFLFVPLVLLGFQRLAEGPGPARLAVAAAALAGLCLSHTVSLLLLPPFLASLLIFLAWRARFAVRALGRMVVACVLGFALAAFFLVPLVAQRGEIDMDLFTVGYFTYDRHFVAPLQLLWSRWGHGLSIEGSGDAMSFRLGALQMLGCVAALVLWSRIRRASAAGAALALYMGLLSAAGIFMSLEISGPVWRSLPPLRYAQFPWRFLILPAIGMPFICGAAAGALRPTGRVRWWLPAAGAALIVAGSVGMIGFEKRAALEKIRFRKVSSGSLRADLARESRPGEITRGWVRVQLLDWADHLPRGAYPPSPPESVLDAPRAEVARGRADLTVTEEGPVRYRISVRAEEPCLVRLNVYRFPGWIWRVDGRPAPWGPPPGVRPLLTVEIPPGVHDLEALYARTAPHWAGDLLSLGGLLVTAALIVIAALRDRGPGRWGARLSPPPDPP